MGFILAILLPGQRGDLGFRRHGEFLGFRDGFAHRGLLLGEEGVVVVETGSRLDDLDAGAGFHHLFLGDVKGVIFFVVVVSVHIVGVILLLGNIVEIG